MYFATYTALTVATGVFLWHPRESESKNAGQVCNEPYTVIVLPTGDQYYTQPTNCTDTVDVYYRFTTILQLFFAFFITNWWRMLTLYFGLCTQSKWVVWQYEVLGLFNSLFGVACLVIVHIYRFQPSGKIASLDFMTHAQIQTLVDAYLKQWDATGVMPDDGQFQRGEFLLGLVIWVWAGSAFLLLTTVGFFLLHRLLAK